MGKKFLQPQVQLLTLAILAVLAIGVHQAYLNGDLHLPQIGNSPAVTLPGRQTQTVVTEESAVISAVDKSSPSVVAIGATQQTFNPYDPFSAPASQNSTIGTGFVVSEDKEVIVTNKHVVDDTSLTYSVVDRSGKKYAIKKIYRDPTLDLALVQVDNLNLPALQLGDSSKLKVGQMAIAIGNALGSFTNTVTTGVISGLGRQITAGDGFSGSSENLDNLIQTDAAINPGNSGGPLLNSAGQVIGVNVATTQGAQNIGFAIPINSVRQIIDQFVQNGFVSKPFLGISYQFISKELAIYYSVPPGAYVQQVIPGSAAEKAGLVQGDLITKIDGQLVDSAGKITGIVAGKKVGDSVTLEVWNNGSTKTVTATLQQATNQ